MCGRYAATKDPAKLAAEFEAVDQTEDAVPKPDYNVAPTKPVLTVVQRHPRNEEGEPDPFTTVRSIRVMRWGLVPSWAKDVSIGSRMINARSESAADKPAFRDSLARRRCLIPADGWYEWQREGDRKQPFYVTTTDGSSLAMAGVWTTWRDPKADEPSQLLITCAVLTTDALGPLADIHQRMPLTLPKKAWDAWLNPDRKEVAELLVPDRPLVDSLELRPVSSAVNSVRNNGPELLERMEGGACDAFSARSARPGAGVPQDAESKAVDQDSAADPALFDLP